MNILKYLTSRKYRFFYKKVNDVQYSIWDMEFKIIKSREVREGVRQDRDRAIENIQMIEAALNNPNITEEYKAKAESDKAVYTDNVSRYEKQMKMIDDQIRGVKATPATETDEGNPGIQGITETVEAYIELRNNYKKVLTSI